MNDFTKMVLFFVLLWVSWFVVCWGIDKVIWAVTRLRNRKALERAQALEKELHKEQAKRRYYQHVCEVMIEYRDFIA